MAGLEKTAKTKRKLRDSLDEYVMPSGKKVHVLGEGRLVNLAALKATRGSHGYVFCQSGNGQRNF